MEIYSGSLKINGENKFAKDYNYISELFSIWQETNLKSDWDIYFDAKCRLEIGL